jgi:hypothetical protein
MRAYTRLDASAVMLNDHTAFRVDWMPFAGLRESGLGVGGLFTRFPVDNTPQWCESSCKFSSFYQVKPLSLGKAALC